MAHMIIKVVLLVHMSSHVWSMDTRKSSKCERITIPMCEDMPYNLTRMPNLMGHKDQSEAAIQVHEFIPLVEIGCSKNLKFFLCSLYAPMCTEQIDIPIPSCQSICEEVRSACLPVLQQFNFNWPHMLNCSRLPSPENGLCMQFPNITDAKSGKQHVSSYSSSPLSGKHFLNTDKTLAEKDKNVLNSIENLYPFLHTPRNRNNEINSFFSSHVSSKPTISRETVVMSSKTQTSETQSSHGTDYHSNSGANKCYPDFVYVPMTAKSANHTETACAPKCGKDILFTRSDKNFVEIWMCIWASICFMSTLFTVFTFWIDASRFRYPEKPIIFLSMCFCISSVAYLIRIYAGSEFVSCDKSDSGEHHITLEGLENSGCIIVFLLLYYFGMAASMWYVILTISWCLASCKKWGHEAIESKASLFHLLAWATPAILTIIVLALRHVDGDELTGLCYVGSQDYNALLYFVIIPISTFVSIGVIILVSGFVALSRIRSVMKHDGHNTNKLERLMVRIGIFTTLYTLPVVCVIGCHVYEYMHSAKWRETAIDRSRVCQDTNSVSSCRLTESIPLKEVFVLKIFMSLVMGISTGIWVWSNKTWSSWTRFCHSTFGRRQRRNFKCPSVQTHSSYVQVGHHASGAQSVVSAASTQFHHLSQQQLYHHSYTSLKSQNRHQLRLHGNANSHRKHRNEVTHV